MAGLLDFVPGARALEALGIGLMLSGAVSIAGGLLYFQPKGDRIGAARVQGRWDAAERARQAQVIKALEAQRADEQHQAALQREALDEAQRLAARSRVAAARAADAGRMFVAAATAGTVAGSGLRASGAAAAASCSAAAGSAILSADVLGEVEQRLRDLAEYAGQAHDAGVTCERSYDALTVRGELTVMSTRED